MRNSPFRSAFTLVEMLVVISIISILMAVLLPAVNAARRAMQKTQCANNLKQITLGVLGYEKTFAKFPPGEVHGVENDPQDPGYTGWSGNNSHCAWDRKLGMWLNVSYPWMDLEIYYDAIDFNAKPQYSNASSPTDRPYDNKREMRRFVPLFHCPSDPVHDALTNGWGQGGETSNPDNVCNILNYFAVGGSTLKVTDLHPGSTTANADPMCNVTNGVFYNDSSVRMGGIRDGVSYTAMLAETWGRVYPGNFAPVAPAPIPVGYPTTEKARGMNGQAYVYFDYPPNSDDPDVNPAVHKIPQAERGLPNRVKSFHPDGAHVALVDGSVHFANDYIESATAQNTAVGVWQYLATIDGVDIVNPKKLDWHQ